VEPALCLGQPVAANPEHEIFHPMTALLFLLPFEWGVPLPGDPPARLSPVLTMFALLRTLRRSRAASLFGGFLGLRGYLLSTSNLLPIFFAVAALPLVVLFAVRVARQGALSTPSAWP
jgi:hypothetical protein